MISNNVYLTNTLINRGANLNIKGISGYTPLDYGRSNVLLRVLKI